MDKILYIITKNKEEYPVYAGFIQFHHYESISLEDTISFRHYLDGNEIELKQEDVDYTMYKQN